MDRGCTHPSRLDDMKLLHNARIYTLEAAHPVASALVIDSGRVLALGGQELLAETGYASREDMGGKVILPGLTDAHLHLQEYALSLQAIDCEGLSKPAILDTLNRRLAGAPPGAWLRGHGWNQNDWGGAWPGAADLDAVAPQVPVYLTAKSLHAAWVNSAALRLAMTGEVFGAGQQVRAVNPAVATLKPTNGGDSDEGGKVRIFAVKLVKASKARLPSQVKHGSGGVANPVAAHLQRDSVKDAFHQRRIPGARQREWHGKYGGIGAHKTVAGFAVKEGGNSEAGFFGQEPLNGALKSGIVLNRKLGVILNGADAVGDLRKGEVDIVGDGFVLQQLGQIGPEIELGDLFFERHPIQ